MKILRAANDSAKDERRKVQIKCHFDLVVFLLNESEITKIRVRSPL